MKILVSAYACEPRRGSEAEVGWQWVRQISRFHETWVITRCNNRVPIEKELMSTPSPNLHFIYCDFPAWARFWKRGNRGVHVYYYLWQIRAFILARKLVRKKLFDVVHHITFINMYIGPWFALLNKPFIWGPLGANPRIPGNFLKFLGLAGIRDNYLRLGISKLNPVFDPMIRLGLRKSKRIIVINKEVQSRLLPPLRDKSVVLSQNAIKANRIILKPKSHHKPLRILSVGQLVSIKGYRISLLAFKKHVISYANSRFEIVGAGPQKNDLLKYVKKLNIIDLVTFLGQIDREQVLKKMENSDVFLFTSFEAAGMVVIEAMAKGMPVVCLDFGGPGEYVTDQCGIKVPLTDPETVIDGLAGALSKLASDCDMFQNLSAGAIERVKTSYLWDHAGDKLRLVYQQVCEEIK